MSRSGPAASFTGATGKLPPLVDCPTCQWPQTMTIRRVYPALYCGKNIVFYECDDCGTGRTEQVPDEVADAAPNSPQKAADAPCAAKLTGEGDGADSRAPES